LDALPVPVLWRLVARATLLDDRPHDRVEEVEEPLALLGEALRDLLEEALVHRLRPLAVALLEVEAVAPELVDVLLERDHRVDLLDVLGLLDALLGLLAVAGRL